MGQAMARLIVVPVLLAAISAGAEDCPLLVGAVPEAAGTAVAVRGDRSVTVAADALRVIDVSDPATPAEIGEFRPPVAWGAECVELHAGHALVCDGYNDRLVVLDVTDPDAIHQVAEIEARRVNDVAVVGQYVYLAADDLLVVDFGNPAEPTIVSSFDHGVGWRGSIAVEHPYLYLTQWSEELWAGLSIYDISQPTSPVPMGSAFSSHTSCCGRLAVAGGWVYVIDNVTDGTSLHVVDARNPDDPIDMGILDLGPTRDVAAVGRTAMVVKLGVPSPLLELDLTNPADPAVVGVVETAAQPLEVTESGGLWYVVGLDTGLEIYDLCGPEPAGTRWLEIAAHGSGVNGSRWRTDVVVRNHGGVDAPIELTLFDSGVQYRLGDTIAAGAQTVFEDVVGLMGIDAKGALEIRSHEPLTVYGRIYTEEAGGTFGQYLEGHASRDGLSTPDTAWLHGLRQLNDTYRTNLSVTNTGPLDSSVRVTLYDSDGNWLTGFELDDIAPGQVVQELEPLAERAGRPDIGWAMAEVRVLSGVGIFASASVIDSRTNDPTTVPMVKEEP